MGSHCNRIDVVFDRYRPDSIKRDTRRRRTKTTRRPIRRVTENCDVPLLNNWAGFLAMEENYIIFLLRVLEHKNSNSSYSH